MISLLPTRNSVKGAFIAIVLIAPFIFGLLSSAEDSLKDYVSASDDSYSYELVGEGRAGTCKVLTYKLTSQTWQGIKWWHWLSVLVPDKIHPGNKGVLVITGGSIKKKDPPKADSKEALLFSMLASQSGAVTAILQQIPNQPLFENLKEDDLIAHSYVKYLDGGNSNWPLLLPMVKSVVRAMDTIETISTEKFTRKIDQFIVTGASKRGWTTWLTAAADKRVCAIAPMVIDMLNTNAQMEQQLRTYGKFSDKIEPYTKRKVQERMATDRGKKLLDIVDPYSYRDRLTLPKFLLLGSNDPYWTVDAANLYFNDLKGSNHLMYVPNGGHGLGGGLPIVASLLNFFKASLENKTLPELNWKWSPSGQIKVDWKVSGGKAQLWHAHSDDRNFRKAKWTSTPITVEGTHCETKVKSPAKGWDAWFVQVDFPDQAMLWNSFGLSTQIKVLPETFPHSIKKK